ncbi:DUF6259 domain-containing protein [Flavitalea antarctica]
MKLIVPEYLFSLLILWTACFISANTTAQTRYSLETANAKLSVNPDGVISIKSDNTGQIINGDIRTLWSLSLRNMTEGSDVTPKIYQVAPTKEFEVKKTAGKILISYHNLSIDKRKLPINIVLSISAEKDHFSFSGNLQSGTEEWQLRDFSYPILDNAGPMQQDFKLYIPNGLGQSFEAFGAGKRSFDYPSGKGSMQWLTINNGTTGFYLASYDTSRGKKRFEISFDTVRRLYHSLLTFPIYTQSFELPPVVVTCYEGKWYEAAKRYRAWYDKSFKIPDLPGWVKLDAGWVLAILKQQNGYVMWKYSDLDKLCDIADKLNLKTIGLFGWANGGHDYLYPNYIPDDLMGGRDGLRDAIQRAHKRGFKIILYANGTIIDASTEYYRYNGNSTLALKEDKEAYTSSIRKYNSSTPVVFVEASYSSSLWRKTMLDLALQANELGADGILYDQVGVKGATLNFSKIQDHKLPQEAGTFYRYMMLKQIRTQLKNINQDFVVMTEGVNDGVFTDIDYYHGWGEGSFMAPDACPELFRYTFPELVKTQRHSSPMLPRTQANYAAVFGLRHEIEIRWEADVDYILKGKLPDQHSYSDEAYYPPDYKTINSTPQEVATRYVHELVAFENRYAEFFRMGKFVDEEGFIVTGKDIVAKGFVNKDRLGIVIWNKNENKEQPFKISVPGYRCILSAEPAKEKVKSTNLMEANSIRLLVYTKTK